MKHSLKMQKQTFLFTMGLTKRIKIGKRRPLSLKAHHWRIYKLISFSFFWFFFTKPKMQLKTKKYQNKAKMRKET